jgi:curved DNA-binding protein CbpA
MWPIDLEIHKAVKTIGVPYGASQTELKIAYRKMALVYHPDVTKLPEAEASEKMKALNAAYELLKEHGVPSVGRSSNPPTGGQWSNKEAGDMDFMNLFVDMMMGHKNWYTEPIRRPRQRPTRSYEQTRTRAGQTTGQWFWIGEMNKWGVLADSGLSGQTITVTRRDGTESLQTLGKVVFPFDGVHSVYLVKRRNYGRRRKRPKMTSEQEAYAQTHAEQAPTYEWHNADGTVTHL